MKLASVQGTAHQLDTIGVTEFVDQDPRPTFILDLKPEYNLDSNDDRHHELVPAFYNQALRSNTGLLQAVLSNAGSSQARATDSGHYAAFVRWAVSSPSRTIAEETISFTHAYFGFFWTAYTVRYRWRVLSAVATQSEFGTCIAHSTQDLSQHNLPRPQNPHRAEEHLDTTKLPREAALPVVTENGIGSAEANTKLPHDPSLQTELEKLMSLASSNGDTNIDPRLALSTPEKGVPDCTALKPNGVLSAHLIFFRSIDWSSTPLGAMETWSREFRQVVNLVMGNPHPASLFWGNELTMLYNEAYAAEVAGNKHPALLGTGFAGPFREIWEGVRPLFVECARTGTSIRKDNDVLFMERRGFIEETYFSWSWTPVYGSGSKILGFYNAPFETTAYCVGQRRTKTLQRLNQSISTATMVADFWQCVLTALEDNPYDIPFALLYSVEDLVESENHGEAAKSAATGRQFSPCVLEGSIGVPKGHPAAPGTLNLQDSDDGWVSSFREAIRTKEPTKLQLTGNAFPRHLMENFKWRGFGDPCQEAVILPLRPTNSNIILSFLLLGCNPRKRYDDEYKAFITLMNRQLATSLASIMLFEEETRRSKIAIEAATLEQEQLNERLAVQTDRLLRMTALSPLGMFNINPEGLILEANDRYFEMTSQRRDELFEMCWLNQLAEDSKETMIEGWRQLTIELRPFSAELRLNKKSIDAANPLAEPMDYWVLANTHPELTANGKLRSIMGSITDISHLKWAQGLQDRRLKEAEETRRQQNEFIDITSHEMRNPMSAVLQCADDIATSLSVYRDEAPGTTKPTINDCIELANTITLCVQHQKTIVDDILTVSKLDSDLVILTPVPVQPLHVIRRIVKLFEHELLSKMIDFDMIVHESFAASGVEWILMDPSRVSQIVINFMTNAIKFTSGRKKRKIIMHMGASNEPPIPTTRGFQYIPRQNTKQSSFLEEDWGINETIYLRVKVEDTGCGLSEDEKQLLFQRFQQASPRTHAQYGGSGLGLFISRKLTELHGGQIGVASNADVGSTFGFFIKARRTSRPETQFITAPSGWEESWLGNFPASSNVFSPTPLVTSGTEAPLSPTSEIDIHFQGLSTDPTPALSILVVEDNLVNQKVLAKQLRKAGCRVEVADNGRLAIDFLQKTNFWKEDNEGIRLTAVLMDLEMPIMDGLTCVKEIRRLENEGRFVQHVPIIAITANVRQEQIDAAKASGMDDVVSKPFRIPDVLAKIATLLERLKHELDGSRRYFTRTAT